MWFTSCDLVHVHSLFHRSWIFFSLCAIFLVCLCLRPCFHRQHSIPYIKQVIILSFSLVSFCKHLRSHPTTQPTSSLTIHFSKRIIHWDLMLSGRGMLKEDRERRKWCTGGEWGWWLQTVFGLETALSSEGTKNLSFYAEASIWTPNCWAVA